MNPYLAILIGAFVLSCAGAVYYAMRVYKEQEE